MISYLYPSCNDTSIKTMYFYLETEEYRLMEFHVVFCLIFKYGEPEY